MDVIWLEEVCCCSFKFYIRKGKSVWSGAICIYFDPIIFQLCVFWLPLSLQFSESKYTAVIRSDVRYVKSRKLQMNVFKNAYISNTNMGKVGTWNKLCTSLKKYKFLACDISTLIHHARKILFVLVFPQTFRRKHIRLICPPKFSYCEQSLWFLCWTRFSCTLQLKAAAIAC